MDRLFMLTFIMSRMLNPLSLTVFLVFFMSTFILFLNGLPAMEWNALNEIVAGAYAQLLFLRLLMFLAAIIFISLILYNALVVGKVVIKRMTFSAILALCIAHLLVLYAAIVLPINLSIQQQQHALHQLFTNTPIEMLTTIMLGILLSLYVGVLSKEKFKKDIGFVDDRL